MADLRRRRLFIVLGVSLVLVLLILAVQTAHPRDGQRPATPVVYGYAADWMVRQHLRTDAVGGRLPLAVQVTGPGSADQPAGRSVDVPDS